MVKLLPEGSYEVTVGRDNKPTDINPINPKQVNPVDTLREEIALRQSFEFSKNYGKMAMKISRLNLLEDLLDATPTGFMAGLADTAFQFFNLDTRSDTAAAAAAIINQLVPEQRQPGSGPMSDADLALFQSSVPSISAKPGGNKLIVKTMQALARYEQDFARIHGEYANNTIKSIAERDRQIWELEDPMKGVRAFMIEQGLIGGPSLDDDVTLSEEESSIISSEIEETISMSMTFAEASQRATLASKLEALEKKSTISKREQKWLNNFRENEKETIDAIVETKAMGQGFKAEATFNLDDEIYGAYKAAGDFIKNRDLQSAKEAYARYRDLVRQKNEMFQYAAPEEYAKGQMSWSWYNDGYRLGWHARFKLNEKRFDYAANAYWRRLRRSLGISSTIWRGRRRFYEPWKNVGYLNPSIGGVAGGGAPVAGRAAEGFKNIMQKYLSRRSRRLPGASSSKSCQASKERRRQRNRRKSVFRQFRSGRYAG